MSAARKGREPTADSRPIFHFNQKKYFFPIFCASYAPTMKRVRARASSMPLGTSPPFTTASIHAVDGAVRPDGVQIRLERDPQLFRGLGAARRVVVPQAGRQAVRFHCSEWRWRIPWCGHAMPRSLRFSIDWLLFDYLAYFQMISSICARFSSISRTRWN